MSFGGPSSRIIVEKQRIAHLKGLDYQNYVEDWEDGFFEFNSSNDESMGISANECNMCHFKYVACIHYRSHRGCKSCSGHLNRPTICSACLNFLDLKKYKETKEFYKYYNLENKGTFKNKISNENLLKSRGERKEEEEKIEYKKKKKNPSKQ
jgi:Fe-S-cluster containining protein